MKLKFKMRVGRGGGGVLHTQRSQTYDLLVTRFNGGSVAEWSAHWTHNLVVLGSSPALATYCSLVPRPVRIIRVTRGGLEPSAIASWANFPDKLDRSPRMTGNEAALTGFVLRCPKFKSLATIVNSQLVTSCQLGFLILLCCI